MTPATRPFATTIQSFLDAASSSAPTPGGGGVAALVAALGSSMTSMVANLTRGQKFSEMEAEMEHLANQMQLAIVRFEQLLSADVDSFNQYMAALKRPKATDEEKAERLGALQTATIAATEVPLALAGECLTALEATRYAADAANKQVLSDLGIAAMLLETAGQSALLTADINILSIKDGTVRAGFAVQRDRLAIQLQGLRDATMGVVRHRMAQG